MSPIRREFDVPDRRMLREAIELARVATTHARQTCSDTVELRLRTRHERAERRNERRY